MNVVQGVHKAPIKSFDEKLIDLAHWLSQPVEKRLEAVTFLISQTVDLIITLLNNTNVERRKIK